MIESVLIANRGEIAARIARTLSRLGVRSIAVYSDADEGAPHTLAADEAVRIGPEAVAESYLSAERLIEAAKDSGAEAVHPGYGFLSENSGFARACAEAGLVFIGPPAEAIELLGDKVAAKGAAESAGVPVVEGLHEPGLSDERIVEFAREAALPIMVKAAAGGGGRGMRIVREPSELEPALAAARGEAEAAFGSDELLVERYLERSRHIELQVIADAHGNAIHLGERECSLQRRHQKVIEEAPSPVVGPALRERIGDAAVALARASGYENAGTVELIAEADDPERFYFLEMNARLQVEHPVTEMVTGVDLVELQLRVASGEELPLEQADVRIEGHAIEARVYAEDPAHGFAPSAGRLIEWREPRGEGVRIDSGVATGSRVGTSYDPMLAKVVARGDDRAAALASLHEALGETRALGLTTNLSFLRRLAAHPRVVAADFDTAWLDAEGPALAATDEDWLAASALAAAVSLAGSAQRAGRGGNARLEPDSAPGADPRRGTAFPLADFWRAGSAPAVPLRLRAHDGTDIELRVGHSGAGRDLEVAIGDGESRPARLEPLGEDRVRVALGGRGFELELAWGRRTVWVANADGSIGWSRRVADPRPHLAGEASLEAQMPGTVLRIEAGQGERVEAGRTILVLESMKMEVAIQAPADGVVSQLEVREGDGVVAGQALASLEPEEEIEEEEGAAEGAPPTEKPRGEAAA